MDITDYETKRKIGIQTVDLLNNDHLKIKAGGSDLLDFKADKNYIVQVTVCLIEK